MRVQLPQSVVSALVKMIAQVATVITVELVDGDLVEWRGYAPDDVTSIVLRVPADVMDARPPTRIDIPDKPLTTIVGTLHRGGVVELGQSRGEGFISLLHWYDTAPTPVPQVKYRLRPWEDHAPPLQVKTSQEVARVETSLAAIRELLNHLRGACYTNPEKAILWAESGERGVDFLTRGMMASSRVTLEDNQRVVTQTMRRSRARRPSGDTLQRVKVHTAFAAPYPLAEVEYLVRSAVQIATQGTVAFEELLGGIAMRITFPIDSIRDLPPGGVGEIMIAPVEEEDAKHGGR